MTKTFHIFTKPIFIILLVAFILRLILAFGFEGTGDTGGWKLGGKTGLEGKQYGLGEGTVYDGKCTAVCVNWPPLTYHYMIAMRWSYLHLNPFHLPSYGFYKLLPVVSSVSIAYLLYILSKRNNQKYPLAYAAFYAFHPIALYVSGFHGQRDSVWLLGLILGIYLLDNKKIVLSAIVLGIALAIKIPIVLYLPYIILSIKNFKDKIRFTAVIIGTFIYLSLPELFIYPEYILERVIGYKGAYGVWGFSGITAKIGTVLEIPNAAELGYPLQKYIMYGIVALFTFLLIHKKVDRLIGIFILSLCILTIMPSYAIQYFLWLLPFLVLLGDRYPKLLFFYTISGVYLALNTYTPFGLPIGATKFDQLNNIFQNYIFYKIPGFSYPSDLSWPIWILVTFYTWKITYNYLTTEKS